METPQMPKPVEVVITGYQNRTQTPMTVRLADKAYSLQPGDWLTDPKTGQRITDKVFMQYVKPGGLAVERKAASEVPQESGSTSSAAPEAPPVQGEQTPDEELPVPGEVDPEAETQAVSTVQEDAPAIPEPEDHYDEPLPQKPAIKGR